ncbi:MAG TPA: hypothetical protein VFF67_01600 [Thermoplasmata archaeon]|nr:hypothetical protein [Thermoplasmata archaeon]
MQPPRQEQDRDDRTKRTKRAGALALVAVGAAVFAMALVPAAKGDGTLPVWELGFSGTGTLGGHGIGFWGWCSFTGNTSGTKGDCQVEHYLHLGGGANLQCQAHFDIAQWYSANGSATPLTSAPDFFVVSANLTVHPATQTANCTALLAGEGYNVTTVGSGAISMGLTDLLIPAAVGHYSYNGITIGPVTYKSLQLQVSVQ